MVVLPETHTLLFLRARTPQIPLIGPESLGYPLARALMRSELWGATTTGTGNHPLQQEQLRDRALPDACMRATWHA